MRQYQSIASGLLAAAFLVCLTARGLKTDLTPDDLQNLHFAWSQPLSYWLIAQLKYWSNAYRPFCSLLYFTQLHTFGFNLLPFRILLFTLMAANAALVWRTVRNITGSNEAGILAAALASVHVNYAPLYYNTGFCYDIVCFFFYFAALAWYTEIRSRNGARPTALQLAGMLALYVCALNSKEIAVTLPVGVLVYDLLFHWRKPALFWPIAGVLTIPYVIGKSAGDAEFFKNAAYMPHFTWNAYLTAWTGYLNDLFVMVDRFDIKLVVLFLAATLLLTIGSRARLFGWLFVVIGVTPIAFIAPRGLAAIYIPVVGLTLLFADLITRLRPSRIPEPIWIAVILAWLTWFDIRAGIYGSDWMLKEQRDIHQARVEQLEPVLPQIRKNAHVLIVHDPFQNRAWGRWCSTFLLRMMKDDHDLTVDRLDQMDRPPDRTSYDLVLDLTPLP